MLSIVAACQDILANAWLHIGFETCAVFAFFAAILRLNAPDPVSGSPILDWFSKWFWLLAAGLLLCELIIYLISPFQFDHGDVSIAAIGAAMRNGQVSHSGLSSGADFYSLPYGPLLYQIQSLATSWSASVLASKLPGIAAFLVGATLLTVRLRQIAPDLIGPVAAFSALVLFMHRHVAFGPHAESFLFLLTALATFIVLKRQDSLAALVVGMAAGAATALKINACLFLAPHALALVFANAQSKNGRPANLSGTLLCMLGGGLVAMAAPLLGPGVNLQGYIDQLLLSARVGYSPTTAALNALELTIILAPACASFSARRKPASACEIGAWTGVGLAGLALIFIGSKLGTGSASLLPFLPTSIGLVGAFARDLPSSRQRSINRAIMLGCAAVIVGFFPHFVTRSAELAHDIRVLPDRGAARSEASALFARYPDAEMGVGGGSDYALSMARDEDQFRGGRLQFDVTAWMEFAYVEPQRAEAISTAFLTDCRVKHWILPAKGAPFSMSNFYAGADYFSEDFRRRFRQNYALVETTPHYAVWACRRAQN